MIDKDTFLTSNFTLTPYVKNEMTKRYCKNCGKQLPDKGKKEYCCWQCQRIAEHPPCPVCGKKFITKNKNQKYCSRECRIKACLKESNKHICEYCGKTFKRYSGNPKDAYRFCSRECAFAWKRENSKNPKKSNVYFLTCKICGKLFTSNNSHKKYCSDECKKENARIWAKEKYTSIKYIKPCVVCKNIFETHNPKQITCSEFCREKYNKKDKNRRNHARRRITRERLIDNDITIQKLHKKYKGICAICGEKLNLKRKVPHPKAPTVDHIFPISKGGWHGWDNVQLACFKCNCEKQDNEPQIRQTSIHELLLA